MSEVNFLKANWNLLDGFKSDQSKGIDHPDIQKPVDSSTSVIDLPAVQPGVIPDMSILEVINSRRSVRQFTVDPVSLEELAWLLWSTQGVQKILGILAKSVTKPLGTTTSWRSSAPPGEWWTSIDDE